MRASRVILLFSAAILTFLFLLKSSFQKFFPISPNQAPEESSFAKLQRETKGDVYLKDSRAFIFSQTKTEQNLKIRDSLFVGPNSKAVILLSEKNGGAKIVLGPNTVITLKQSGQNEDFPMLEVKQGQIQIIPQSLRKKLHPSDNRLPAAENTPAPLVLSHQGKALVFDSAAESANITVNPASQKSTNEPEKENSSPFLITPYALQNTPTEALPPNNGDENSPVQTAPVILELSKIETMKMTELKISLKSPDETKSSDLESTTNLENPEKLAEDSTREAVMLETSPTSGASQENTVTDAPTSQTDPEKTQSSDVSEKPEIDRSRLKPFEISLDYASRKQNYNGIDRKLKTIQLRTSTEHGLNEKFSLKTRAHINIFNMSKPSDVQDSVLRFLSGEVKYRILKNSKLEFALIGSYSLWQNFTVLNSPSIQTAYAPSVGFDWSIGKPESTLTLSPRYARASEKFSNYEIRTSYSLNPLYDINFSYEQSRFKVLTREGSYDQFSLGLNYKVP